jgi:hypothetical protein
MLEVGEVKKYMLYWMMCEDAVCVVMVAMLAVCKCRGAKILYIVVVEESMPCLGQETAHQLFMMQMAVCRELVQDETRSASRSLGRLDM